MTEPTETTADFDKGEKKLIYQNQARVPEYFWYDFESGEFAGFALREGEYTARGHNLSFYQAEEERIRNKRK